MKSEILIKREAKNENDSKKFAADLKKYIIPGTTFLLYGDLGSGKTFLVREIASILNVRSDVASPSFALVYQYKADININHIDLYRISDANEIYNIGLDELLNSESVNFIEWPQLIEKNIFWDHYRIYIYTDSDSETGRKFELYKLC